VLRRYAWIPISALLLAFVLWRTRPWEVAYLAARLDPLPILAAVALNGVVLLLWAIRSRSLMAGVGHPLSVVALIPVVSFANTIGNLTPASAGEALRAVVLRKRHGVPLTRSTAVILVERVWAMWVMAVSSGAAAVVALARPEPLVAALVWLAALTGCFAPSISYAVGLRPGRLLERWLKRRAGPSAASLPEATQRPRRGARLLTGLVEVDRTLAGLLTDPRRAVVFVATTAGVFTCYAAQLMLLLGGLGQPLPIDASWAALGLATVAGVLSALPFGLGAADAVLVVVLGQLGVSPAIAGAAVLLVRATATLPLGIAGAISWALLGGRGGMRDPAPDDPSPG